MILSHRYFWLQQIGVCWRRDILPVRKQERDFWKEPRVADLLDRITERAGDRRVRERNRCHESPISLGRERWVNALSIVASYGLVGKSSETCGAPHPSPRADVGPGDTDLRADAICTAQHVCVSLSRAPSVDTTALLTHL